MIPYRATVNPSTWPLWLRCQISGVTWAGLMHVFTADHPLTPFTAAVSLLVGVVIGLAMWALLRVQHRRMFGEATGAERVAAVAAVTATRVPGDPRQREAAVRIARAWAKPRRQIVFQVAVWTFFVLLGIYLAVSVTPWWCAGVALFAAVGGLSLRSEQRNRRAGHRFLAAAGAAASPPEPARSARRADRP